MHQTSFIVRATAIYLTVVMLGSVATAQSIGSNLNLVGISRFCLSVNIQSQDAAELERRANELQRYLLDQALLYNAPVINCSPSDRDLHPTIRMDFVVLSGFHYLRTLNVITPSVAGLVYPSIWGMAGLVVDVRSGDALYRSVQDAAQRALENLVVQWRGINDQF